MSGQYVRGVVTACTCGDGFGALHPFLFDNGLISSFSFSHYCQYMSPGTEFCCQVVQSKGRRSFLSSCTMGVLD
jgi:hypothetical protein